jgi:hypothetical protein
MHAHLFVGEPPEPMLEARGMATRYDKLAVPYQATVTIAAINEWL